MLRSRIMAAATAAVLMLGVSVGGASAAFAEADEALSVVDQTSVVESSTESASEAVVEPAPEPVVEPAPEPVVQPATNPATTVATRQASGGSVTPAVVPAGITVTVNGPNPFTCNSSPRNYDKPDSWNTSDNAGVTEAWGTATWSENGSFSWTINPGYDVNLCIKGGQTIVEIDTSVFTGSSYAFKAEQGSGISHAGFKVERVADPTVTVRATFICKVAEDGEITNAPGTFTAGDYVFRIRHEAGPATDYTAGVGGSGLFSGNLSVGEVEYVTTGSAVAGVSVKTTPLTNTHLGTASTNETACGTPPPPPTLDCVVVVWEMPRWASNANNPYRTPTWPQTLVSVHETDCTTPISEEDIPVPDDCGTQYQLDKYYKSDVTDSLITGGYLNGPNNPKEDLVRGGWNVAYMLVKNPDCELATAAVTVVERDCIEDTSFDIDEGASENVTWGDEVIDLDAGTISITATADSDARFDGALDGVSPDRTQRVFTAPYEPAGGEDCELGSVVVPIVTYEDYCEGAGPNALRVATFTVTDVDNASYTYTVNGGSPIAIDFDGELTVTIAVDPLDVVEVTAEPDEGFELNDGYEPWKRTFVGAAFCPGTLPATEAAADITPGDCDGNSPVVTLTNEGGVIWTLNGKVVDGNETHTLPWGSAIVLTAALEGPTDENPGGWTWNDGDEQQTLWTADGMSEEDCLSSLAFTGSSSATEWIGAAAALMMIAGMGFVIRRRLIVG